MTSNVDGNSQTFVTGFMPLRSSTSTDVSESIQGTEASNRTITPVWMNNNPSVLQPIKSSTVLASGIVIASRSSAVSSSVAVFGPRPIAATTQETTNDRLDRILEAALPLVIPAECIVQTNSTVNVATMQVNPVLPSFTSITSPPTPSGVDVSPAPVKTLPDTLVKDDSMAIDIPPANVPATEKRIVSTESPSKPEPNVVQSTMKIAADSVPTAVKKQLPDTDYEPPARTPLQAKRRAISVTPYVPPFKVLQLGLSSGDTPDTLHAYLYDCSYTKDVKLRTTVDALKDMLLRLNPKANKDFAQIEAHGHVAADNTASQFVLTLTKTSKQRHGGRRGYMDNCGRSIFLVHREEPTSSATASESLVESQSPPTKKAKTGENPS
jgi:hypothetical protein